MSIIKEAFEEGRETDVEWSDSLSKQKELKLEVALDNMERLSKKEYNKIIPLQQVCPITGNVLRTFPSRLAAAKWIVENVLKQPDKNPISITGNMEMCMRGGWKSYGYYWRICELQDTVSAKTVRGGQKVFVRKLGKDAVFNSITEAADFIGISRKALGAKLKNNGIYVGMGKIMAQNYNPERKSLEFASINDASRKTGMGEAVLRKLILEGSTFNNYTFITNKAYKPKYMLYKGGRRVGVYNTIADVARATAVSNRTVNRYLNSGKAYGALKYRIAKV